MHRSALKHGITRPQIEHPAEHLVTLADLEPNTDPSKVLLIGPDEAGNLLELIGLVLEGDELVTIHAMRLRPQFFALLPDPTE